MAPCETAIVTNEEIEPNSTAAESDAVVGAEGKEMESADQAPSTPDPDRIPSVTAEWVAQPGDARRATLTILRSRQTWTRTLMITLGLGFFLAALFLIMGTTWWDLLILLAIFVPIYFVLIPLVSTLCAHLQNRKVLRAGSRWAAGSDATRIRIDNPVNTIIIERANIESVKPSWAMVLITVRPKQRYAVPAALFSGLLTDRDLRVTADDLSL